MSLKKLGLTESLSQFREDEGLAEFEVGRVIAEHKDRYIVKTNLTEFEGQLTGKLRFSADDRHDLPAVGDWVAFSEFDEEKVLIHAVYPRKSILERQAVGKSSEYQVIATNVDFGLLVQSVDQNFNLNRLERYLTICHTAKVKPIIVLSKIDLIQAEELSNILGTIQGRIPEIKVMTVSNQKENGYEALANIIESGKTYCLLGSSGVGKSTLLNNLLGHQKMETGEISAHVGKGKHVTSHRELIILDNGGILIDNPGMREIGITDSGSGLETTFDAITALAQNCRYHDCTHQHEAGCAVLAALDEETLDPDAYENYCKLARERDFFESSNAERKKKDKDLGKLIKSVKKDRKRRKY